MVGVKVKKCSRCGEAFGLRKKSKDGLQYAYRICNNVRSQVFYTNNKESHRQSCNNWRANNQEKQKANDKKWYEANKEHMNKRDIEYKKQRKMTDPVFKLKQQIRVNVNNAIRRIRFCKSKPTEEIVGCGIDFLIKYLEKTAIDNYRFYDPNCQYHIDHIKPLATANTIEEVLALNHYTNLQLLTPKDNLDKSDKY